MGADVRVEEVPLPRDREGHADLRAIRTAVAPGGRADDSLGDLAVLETAPDAPGSSGWSYATVRSVARLQVRGGSSGVVYAVMGHEDVTGRATFVAAADRDRGDLGPFATLDRCSEAFGIGPHDPPSPGLPAMTGGWVGVLGHDLARHIERLPNIRAPRTTPDVWLDLVDTVLAWHPDHDRALLLHRPLGWDAPDLRATAQRLQQAATTHAASVPAGPPPTEASSSLGRDGHRAAVERTLEHIAAGDVFQANVTHQLTAAWSADAWDLYARLRGASPAAYGAVVPGLDHIAGGGTLRAHHVASVSPETFLHVEAGRVRVRPIKGTRPRHHDQEDDALAAAELAGSAKDRAENVMVVDMERNDLGRVCEVGTVRVPRLLDVERHPTVWHLVSTVEGTLRRDVGWGGLLRATFPCGSVTGTPKVRALQLIEEIEPVRRGVYCGAIGFLGAGTGHLSVAIRTAVLGPDGNATYGTGGGIVADSDPDDEWQESLDKAAAFFTATGSNLRQDQR